MFRKAMLPAVLLVSMFVITPAARADICFQYGSGGGLSVALGAKLPERNTCAPITLVEQLAIGSRLGVATGSICRGEGVGFPVMVLQYTYTACAGPGGYFESATCQVRLNDQSELPTGQTGGQVSSCNGFYASLPLSQSGPLRQFSDTTLKVWSCSSPAFTISNAGDAQCRGGRTRNRAEEGPALDAPLERRP